MDQQSTENRIAYSMMGAERSLVTVFLRRMWANGLGLVGEGGGETNSEEILLLSAMLYGRGRKVLTLWGGRECSSSDSGVRAGRPGDTNLSSWPILVLLALDKKRELSM